MAGLTAAYALLGAAALALSQSALVATGWVATVPAAADPVTGVWLVDLLLVFFQDACGTVIGTRLFESVVALAGAVAFNLIVEASRRRNTLAQPVVGAFLLFGQLVGVGVAVPVFLALLHRSPERDLPRHRPSYELAIMRAVYLVLANLFHLFSGLLLIPLTATSWPAGDLSFAVVLAFIFGPALVVAPFAFDKPVDDVLPRRSTRSGSYSDRELAHFLVMLNCGLSAVAGLIVHIRLLASIFAYYDSFADLADELMSSPPAQFLFIDYLFLLLPAYLWLQVEAMGPIKSYFASTNMMDSQRSESGARLLTWRDVLAILVFGPSCHFSLAFASREYGLMNLDNLRLKSN